MNNKNIPLKKGDVIILPPDENIVFYSHASFVKFDTEYIVRTKPKNLLVIQINDKMFENEVDIENFFISFNDREKYTNNIFSENDFYPQTLFHNSALMFADYVTDNQDYFQFKNLVATLITQINYNHDKNFDYFPVKYSRDYEVKIFDYIIRNYNKKITVKHLCEKFFVSKVYINKVTNKFYSMNFNETIQNLRMNEALNLIKRNADLKEISTLCGYTSYSSFYRCFVNFFKMSPIEMKKEIHKK